MAHTGPGQSAPTALGGDLAQLVATEQELEGRLARAREEARSLIAAATANAEARALEHERNAGEARARFQAEVERERTRRAAELLAEGKRRAAKFDDLPDASIALLADVVLECLLAGGDR
jgi:vacuolar-type H+-ATPase subunit H